MSARMIRAVQACRRRVAGLEDEATWRDFLEATAAKRSLRAMSGGELSQVLDELHRRGAPAFAKASAGRAGERAVPRDGPQAKITALWLSLYHLGAIDDPSEAHLAAFAARELEKNGRAPVAARQWLDQDGMDVVIKALRGWCARVGFAQPDAMSERMIADARRVAALEPAAPGFAAKVRLIEAQWQKLETLGALKYGSFARLDTWLRARWQVAAPWFLAPDQADAAIEKLGTWVRASRRRLAAAPQHEETE